MNTSDLQASRYTTEVGATWAGTHSFRAGRLYLPETIAEAAAVIRLHDRIRVVGTRHSFNDIADGMTMISLQNITPSIDLSEESRTVTVSSAVSYGVLASALHERGWALKNMGSLPHISVAGATATGTHGSGDLNEVLGASVAALRIIKADGSIEEVDRTHLDFHGLVPSLGALGVITDLTLDIEAAYDVRQDVYRELPWSAVADGLDAVMAAGYSVSIFTTWDEPTISRVLVKTRVTGHAEPPEWLLGASRIRHGDPALAALGENRTESGGVAGPWLDRLPHFRLDATPSHGDEIQSEYFVDRRHGPAAIAAVRELAADIAPHLIATEIRSTAPDRLWLSMAYERPSLAIHFTWLNEPEAVVTLLPRIERALAPFEARPHWGKAFAMSAATIEPLYPRFHDFTRLRERWDPAGKFTNDFLDRVMGAYPRPRPSSEHDLHHQQTKGPASWA